MATTRPKQDDGLASPDRIRTELDAGARRPIRRLIYSEPLAIGPGVGVSEATCELVFAFHSRRQDRARAMAKIATASPSPDHVGETAHDMQKEKDDRI